MLLGVTEMHCGRSIRMRDTLQVCRMHQKPIRVPGTVSFPPRARFSVDHLPVSLLRCPAGGDLAGRAGSILCCQLKSLQKIGVWIPVYTSNAG